jgi:hypothetical protein
MVNHRLLWKRGHIFLVGKFKISPNFPGKAVDQLGHSTSRIILG